MATRCGTMLDTAKAAVPVDAGLDVAGQSTSLDVLPRSSILLDAAIDIYNVTQCTLVHALFVACQPTSVGHLPVCD